MTQCHHFIENAPETPNIRFLIIHFILPDLWSHDVWGTDFGFCHIECLVHQFGDTEITNF
jgi:hypothetical protein